MLASGWCPTWAVRHRIHHLRADYQTRTTNIPPRELRMVEVLRFPTLFPRIRPLLSLFSRLVRLATRPRRHLGALNTPGYPVGALPPALLTTLEAGRQSFRPASW